MFAALTQQACDSRALCRTSASGRVAGNLEASIPAEYPGGTLRKHLWKEVYNLFRTLLSKCDFYSEAGVLSK